MAETLGSLIDKLTIKAIRESHIEKALRRKSHKFSKAQLKKKLSLLKKQKIQLLKEIEAFIGLASSGCLQLRDEKLKLYNKLQDMGKIGKITTIARGIDALAKKNLELWNLEDEARRTDKPLTYTGQIKRKIDKANQQRNDLIDRLDELMEARVAKPRARSVPGRKKRR